MRSTDQKLQEAEIIIRETKSMRSLQKAYFKAVWEKDDARKASILPQSKAQEKKVDEMIERYNSASLNTLF